MPGNGNSNDTEIAGSKGRVEAKWSNVAAEVKGERVAPVKMDAGTHGLSDAPSHSPPTSRKDTSPSRNESRREGPTERREPLQRMPTPDIEED